MRKWSTQWTFSYSSFLIFLLLSQPLTHTVTWLPTNGPTLTGQEGNEPDLVLDPNGNFAVIWENTTAVAIQTATLAPGSTIWSAPTTVTSGVNYQTPHIAFHTNGDAAAVWRNVALNNVQGAIYTALTSTWSAPTNLGTAQSVTPQVAVYSNGDAIAIWDRNGIGIQTSIYSGAWSAPTTLSVASVRDPKIGVDAADNAIAVWNLTSTPSVQASRLPAGMSWIGPVDISTLPLQSVIIPLLGVYDSGNALAVWPNTVIGNSQSNFYSSNTQTWNASPSDVYPIGETFFNPIPQIAIYNANESAAAIWDSPIGIRTSFYSSLTHTWSTPITLATTGGIPQIAFDDNGNLLAVWVNSSTSSIQGATLWASSNTWMPLSSDIPLTGTVSSAPQISFNAQGEALVLWTEDIAGTLEVNSVLSQNLFPPEPVQNMTTIAGQKVFATQTECFNRITWQANTIGPQPTSYQIYRNGILIATVPVTTFSYESHNLPCSTSYTYEVAGVID